MPEEQSNSEFKIKVVTVSTNQRIYTAQAAFILDETRYRTLKSKSFNWLDWAKRSFFIFLASFGILVCKYIDGAINNINPTNNPNIQMWEIYAPFTFLFLSGIFLIVEYFSNTEKKKLIKEIDKHFKDNPSTLTIQQMND